MMTIQNRVWLACLSPFQQGDICQIQTCHFPNPIHCWEFGNLGNPTAVFLKLLQETSLSNGQQMRAATYLLGTQLNKQPQRQFS